MSLWLCLLVRASLFLFFFFFHVVAILFSSLCGCIYPPSSSTPLPTVTEAIKLEDLEPKELSLTGILGQIRIKDWNFFLRNSVAEDMDEFGKVGAEMSYLQSQMDSDYDSAESIADLDLEDGELRKKLVSPVYVQIREDCESSRMPIAPGNLLHCFHFGAKNQKINSRVPFSKTLIRQIWEDLFLKGTNIICLVRQYLKL